MSESLGACIKHIRYLMATRNAPGYRFGPNHGWWGSKSQKEQARKQYVTDMRWVRALVRASVGELQSNPTFWPKWMKQAAEDHSRDPGRVIKEGGRPPGKPSTLIKKGL